MPQADENKAQDTHTHMPSTAQWATLPLHELEFKARNYLQLGFALPGAPSDRVEIRKFAVLLRFSLSFFSGRLFALDGLFQGLLGDGCIGGITR